MVVLTFNLQEISLVVINLLTIAWLTFLLINVKLQMGSNACMSQRKRKREYQPMFNLTPFIDEVEPEEVNTIIVLQRGENQTKLKGDQEHYD